MLAFALAAVGAGRIVVNGEVTGNALLTGDEIELGPQARIASTGTVSLRA